MISHSTYDKAPGTAQPAEVRQYSKAGVLGVWAAAALPMAVLAWVVAPAIAGHGAGERRFVLTLLTALTFGLIWQAALVLILVWRESRDLSWTSLRDRLWLRQPSTETRRGGRLWWWVPVFALALGALDMLPFGPTGPSNRDFGLFLDSAVGRATFHHAWGLYALVAVELMFNTVLGEEMLFRGLLLPRMRAAFGRADWVVNGVLFGFYHLHEPWVIPNAIVTGFLCAYPTRRFRSAWMGIAIHSVEAVFFLAVLLTLVLS
jgi:membrane protease YdiL (CAAX protease family)